MATTKKPAKKKLIVDYKTLRVSLRLNQSEFWGKVGVTQSAGSRYESGRDVPKPTAVLAYLIHVEKQEIDAKAYQ